MRALIAALLIFISTPGNAEEMNIPVQAMNCNLSSPPDNAGEISVHAILAKVYPRKSDIPPGYTGCQTTWIRPDAEWEKLFVSYYKNGVLAMFWSADDVIEAGRLCRYQNAQLTAGNPEGCMEYEAVKTPQGSLPPGCIQSLIDKTPSPENCMDDY